MMRNLGILVLLSKIDMDETKMMKCHGHQPLINTPTLIRGLKTFG
jgi:hypothetical protein